MDATELLDLCLGFPGAWPDNPWDHEYPVIKVGEPGKIFAFVGADSVGVKAGPNRDVADEWLNRFPEDASVMAYIGRSGWNSLSLVGGIPHDELVEAVETSYRIVVGGLAKKHRPMGWDSVGEDR
ncbi:MAG: MmcQ/YjbR family DNA-binding protein [Nocardioidaceae bacterium]|nr:MmcQ/YjbR family DNA-binding protein [Nocardioidaceae bacterium]